MNVSSDQLLEILPPFTNNSVLIEKNQEIHDIIKEVLEAHKYFAADYDFIYQFFDIGSTKEICKRLFDFCKDNITYKIETEEKQTTKSPAAILAIGQGDCKHYAGFIAGVLSAISRNTDKKINWFYRFASYSVWNDSVGHVFVVVNDKGKEIWIDPVLCCFDTRQMIPVKTIDKKINNSAMLNRISGLIGTATTQYESVQQPVDYGTQYLQTNAQTQTVNVPVDIAEDPGAVEIPANLTDNIKMLLYYGIIDADMNVYSDKYVSACEALDDQDADALSNAYGSFLGSLQDQTIGDIFGDIWGAVKQVVGAPARGAYLSLVSLNVFNLAGHLNKCITNADGSKDQAGIDKLHMVWRYKLRGDTNLLLRAIHNGAAKKAILGISIGAAPAVPAWVVAASAIIAAMTPIITQILKSKNSFDSLTASQLAMQPINQTSTFGSSTIQKYLPYILIGGVGLYIYFDSNKKKH